MSDAACLVAQWISSAQPDSRLAAVLPDVLRAGSRYSRWRDLIEEHCVIESIDLIGQFAPAADIDVFLLHLRHRPTIAHSHVKWYSSLAASGSATLENRFSISVGSVVPHRH